jgi:hemerythrin superfamily protein
MPTRGRAQRRSDRFVGQARHARLWPCGSGAAFVGGSVELALSSFRASLKSLFWVAKRWLPVVRTGTNCQFREMRRGMAIAHDPAQKPSNFGDQSMAAGNNPVSNPSNNAARAPSRAAVAVRTQVLNQLKEDHKRVKKAYRDFQKLDLQEDAEACEGIVHQVLEELTVHADLEEELLYPAARSAIATSGLIDEAEVEHESLHALIESLRGLNAQDEKFAARFTVLCEYVMHHVKEEEGEIFPELENARLDWESLGAEFMARRKQLLPDVTEAQSESDGMQVDGSGLDEPLQADQNTLSPKVQARRSPKSEGTAPPTKAARRA